MELTEKDNRQNVRLVHALATAGDDKFKTNVRLPFQFTADEATNQSRHERAGGRVPSSCHKSSTRLVVRLSSCQEYPPVPMEIELRPWEGASQGDARPQQVQLSSKDAD